MASPEPNPADGFSSIWILPCKSQEFLDPPRLVQHGDAIDLTYDFETESGEYHTAKIRFEGVQAFQFTEAESCAPEQASAYDRLLVSRASPWLLQLRAQRASEVTLTQHYRVFFDEVGCYDVIASDVCLPET